MASHPPSPPHCVCVQVVILMGCWWVGNTLRNSLGSTGAFEVLYQGQLVFSKLAAGRMPTLGEVLDGIRAASPASAPYGRGL